MNNMRCRGLQNELELSLAGNGKVFGLEPLARVMSGHGVMAQNGEVTAGGMKMPGARTLQGVAGV